MMAPTAVLRDGVAELVLGSAGSNRIRSAILQTIVRVVDQGMRAGDAVRRARASTSRTASCTPSRGSTPAALEAAGRAIARFRDLNLFFGGVQAVERDRDGGFWGGGDPRRGGAAIIVGDEVLALAIALAGRARRLRPQRPVARSVRAHADGAGRKLTLLVNDGGTIRCNGGAARSLPDPLLLQARDLATRSRRRRPGRNCGFPRPPNSVYRYNVRLQSGTIWLPGHGGGHPPERSRRSSCSRCRRRSRSAG